MINKLQNYIKNFVKLNLLDLYYEKILHIKSGFQKKLTGYPDNCF